MSPVVIFLFGLAVLGLFFWYFGVDELRQKRRVGTVLSVVVTLFCLWTFVAPRDGRLIETLVHGNQRGDEGRLFGNIPLGIDLRGGSSFTVRIDPSTSGGELRPVTPDIQEQARAILEKRLNAFGTVDLAIIPQGTDRLEIQMPGVKKQDFDAVRDVIQRVARLEFRLVHPNSAQLLAQKQPGEPLIEPGYVELPLLRDGVKEEERREQKARELTTLRGSIDSVQSPQNFNVAGKPVITTDSTSFSGGEAADLRPDRYLELIGRFKDGGFLATEVHFLPTIVVKNKADVSGKDVTRAVPHLDASGWVVSLELTAEGGEKMERTTRNNVGNQLAIVVDEEVISAPRINSVLQDRIQITGNFSEQEVRELASALNNPLENPLQVINENAISAAYGEDTIRQGVYAGLAGLAAILVFMVIYYRAAGLIAIGGIIVNAIILFGFMAISHSTLTMLGIAAIILTIGMGIDANVLIYERLREELKQGKTMWAALQAGYNRAFSAIFDGHMTSLLTAVILFTLAGGTIRGFAISLTIGVLASLFGSLLVTRTIFNYFPNLRSLKFLDLIKGHRFDFMGQARYWLIFSVLVLLTAIGSLVWKGERALGPDLRGGDKIIISDREDIASDVAEEAARRVDKSASVQIKTTLQGTSFLEVRTSPNLGNDVLNAISQAAGGESLTEEAEGITIEKIGPQVGDEMLRTSTWALLAGVFGILLYLTFRFEFSFSLGAIAATFHDLTFCVGAIVLTGRDLNLLQVGALLTIAGYSVNDTVVIFDRIREHFHTHKGSIRDIMNEAIASTLGRTILTSTSTLITVVFLYFFGGPQLSDFAFTIIVGILVGTYSSIFIASPVVYWWSSKRKIDLRQDVIDAAAARTLASSNVEREVSPRKL